MRISVVHSYRVISSNILSMIQCNVLVCEQFNSYSLQTYIAAVGRCFLAHVNAQRSCSQLVYTEPLVYTRLLRGWVYPRRLWVPAFAGRVREPALLCVRVRCGCGLNLLRGGRGLRNSSCG